ncbi:MAG TPA: PKD domain-containing protein, partial [Cytophagaceae bacterium]
FKISQGTPNEFKFIDVSSADIHKSYWSFGDGNTGSGGIVVHSYAKPGKYQASLTIATFDEKGNTICKDISYQTVFVDEMNDEIIALYPNPINYEGKISLKNVEKDVDLTIYNHEGVPVKKIRNISNGITNFSVEELQNGFYFYHIISDGKIIKTDRFSVSK